MGTVTQPAGRGAFESSRLEMPRGSGSAAPEEEFSRPRAPGPTEADGPRIWGNGYLSPVYRFDGSTSTLFFEQRAFVTGDTTRQVPLESAVKLYSLFEEVRQSAPPASASIPASPTTAGENAQAARPPAAGPANAPQENPSQASVPAGETVEPPVRQNSGAAVGQLLDIVA
ncbi:MAG: hypothetical protein ACK4ZN_01155 [Oceanibaculum sp.]